MLIEDFPSSHAADTSRRHRWIRGDWQLLAWLWRRGAGRGARVAHPISGVSQGEGRGHPRGSRVPGRGARVANPISGLSQWKVLDNLRRSVMPVALVALLAVGWTSGAGWFASLAVIAIAIAPSVLAAAGSLARRPVDQTRARYLRDVLGGLARQLARDGF